ncbi:hypothetical protein FE257_006742 [Aspergillus nanangensis]|uniref:FAD-binding PCMH-type domain-containing protein n=1 Tax=Aspergillus nanangensis TaxID=2582783 RepID=A0AAD4CPF7_ASPNN|nr:hypothetical protein FE257_006742 [Aspergillus nanangensis]
MSVPGSNNIDDGVTIDLGLLNSVTYSPQTKIASLGPGAKWGEVYSYLAKHGRLLAGGRDGGVSAGGVITGGGISYHTCRVGFRCDQVINFEVVLADSRILNANKDTNPTLFKALKGGGNNFGILTRFDVIADALACFVNNVATMPNDHVMAMWAYHIRQLGGLISIDLLNLDGEEFPKSLTRFLDIPGPREAMCMPVQDKVGRQIVTSGQHDTWYTLTIKADPALIRKASSVFATLRTSLEMRLAHASPGTSFNLTMFLQPIAVSFTEHSHARDGNMMALKKITDNAMLVVCATKVDTTKLNDEIAAPALWRAMRDFEDYARAVNGLTGFEYANYSDATQSPLGNAGDETMRFLWSVSRQFDPQGVFQTRVPGGFKLQNAETDAARLGFKL